MGRRGARLQKGGHRVTVVDQLPSTGTDPAALGDLTADAHHVRVVLDTLDEPVVLVGHSYGGMVLTELADHPKVRHSVYLAAFWPQRGQSQLDLGQPLPPERSDDGRCFVVGCGLAGKLASGDHFVQQSRLLQPGDTAAHGRVEHPIAAAISSWEIQVRGRPSHCAQRRNTFAISHHRRCLER